MKRGLSMVAAVASAGLILSGCASAPEDSGSSSVATADYKACAVSDEGSWNDKSFNQSAHGGLEEAEAQLGVSYTALESASTDDFEPNLDTLLADDCDVIFGVGFAISDAVNAAATANPDQNYVVIDGSKDADQDNLKVIEYKMQESSYLAGYLAAAYSTSKVVGTYGGVKYDSVTIFMDGFYYGAKAYEEETGTEVTVLGWDPETQDGQFVGDFANTGVAKQISAAMLEQGADVIYPVAGSLFTATSEAINESSNPDAVFLGVDEDIATTQPEYADQVLTSVEKRMTQAVFDVIQESMEDGFTGDAHVGTLENDGTGLSDFGEFDSKISDEVKTRLDELKAGIIDGSIDPLS